VLAYRHAFTLKEPVYCARDEGMRGPGWKEARGALLGVALSACGLAVAAPPTPPPTQFEVTPFVGYRVGGNFEVMDTGQHLDLSDHPSYSLALDARADELTQYELFYGRQATSLRGNGFTPVDLTVEYLQIGGTAEFDEDQRVKPYIAGGLGVARLSPDSAVGQETTNFSLSLALGLRVPFSRHFSLRLEGRGFITPINTSSAVFCSSGQSGALCTVTARGSVFFQFDFLAGAAFAF
jgi:opacity protein-like surface antigen